MKKFVYALFMFPIVTLAAGTGIDTSGPIGAISSITTIIDKVIPLLVGIAMLVFLWGVLKYVISSSEDPEKRKEARGFMIWGIVALFVMVSVWGLVGILQNASGVGTTGATNLPKVPTQ